ncbi:MAG TPA: O-antigen ligase family protein [Pyrinomonadaceae bacterium]|nr:O-antigen ligase family protein [Pyrinomonadaceae bacterium]
MIPSTQSSRSPGSPARDSRGAALGQGIAILGFFLYAAFAPHSIAGAEIALGITAVGWLIRTLATGSLGLRHTKLDLPIWLFTVLTIASSLLSEEPRISIAKLQSVCVFFLFYITQAIVTRRTAILLVCIMIVSGIAGTLYSVFDLARGRGVIVETIRNDSPLRQAHVEAGDAIWRVAGRRIYSIADIDAALKAAPTDNTLAVSVISRGEHVERTGLVLTEKLKRQESLAGITGSERTHRFRASGWTRHYETFSEILQILAQLALGLALAQLRNHGASLRFKLAIAASAILALGIALTAMRTVLVAFAIGAVVILLRAARGKTRLVATAGLGLLLAFGAFFVWQTRAQDALALRDSSSALRLAVARVGAARILLHPVFGHGMDAVHKHWSEWGFPGDQLIGLHSTPLQLAFDRGLPALFCWLWLMLIFWLTTVRAEQQVRDTGDTNSYGLLLGASGAIAGFFASSLVNYNFGDAEVALVFWWLMGIVVVLASKERLAAPGDL